MSQGPRRPSGSSEEIGSGLPGFSGICNGPGSASENCLVATACLVEIQSKRQEKIKHKSRGFGKQATRSKEKSGMS